MTTSTTAAQQAGAMPLLTSMAPTTEKRSMSASAGRGTVPASGRRPMPRMASHTSADPATGLRWAAPRTDRHQTPSTRGGLRVAPFRHCDDFKLKHYQAILRVV